jgi:hypothetical protein
VDDSHATGKCTPDDHDAGKIDGRLETDKKHVGWWLEDDICHEENHKTYRVLVRCELEISGHTSNLRIADAEVMLDIATLAIDFENVLGAVHVRQQVHEPYCWQQEQVNLPDELLLFFGRPCELASNLNLLRGVHLLLIGSLQ